MIPVQCVDRLKQIFSADVVDQVLDTFSSSEVISIRVNPLKASFEEVKGIFQAEGVLMEPVAWAGDIFILKNIAPGSISRHRLVGDGKIYQQSLSSALAAVVLDPQPGEYVLDACAAPGSKTTQIAALMRAQGDVVAVEAVRSRFFRLRSVVELLAARNVACKLCDVRRFKPFDERLFDRILVDAPCSSEGRFRSDDPQTTGYWSLRKIKEMSFKQKGILMSASRLLAPGGALVYATCTFAPEENEEVIDWFMRKNKGEFYLEDIVLPGVARAKGVGRWGKDVFVPEVMKCWRVMPDKIYTGFFMAKLRRA